MQNGTAQVGGASEAASSSPAPAVDYLSAESILAAATDRHAALVELRDRAPEHCSPAEIGTALDRHFLSALIAAHERAMDQARHRSQAVANEADRVSAENVRLRHELRLARAEIEHLRTMKGAA